MNDRPTINVLVCLFVLAGLVVAAAPLSGADAPENTKFSTKGPTEKTPSYSQYFTWINNTNEGATEKNTLANLDFFKWLHDEYGMVLDIYAFDAGAIDGPRHYGTISDDTFKSNYPNGWDAIVKKAAAMGTRLGVWLGPDGFGDTPAEEKARRDMLVKLCKEYKFALFKMDAVCSQLRESKQEALKQTLIECRKHSPDLILLNHRLKLGVAEPHATTFLWGGAETYIDVHMANWASTAPHNRASALSRGLPPKLMRLTEDHGVCISSCIDFWDDDLILQAFNRCLILAPETYGSPWFMRDDEYPKFARINNLHRRWRDIMVNGIVLPEEQYGRSAVSRGDESTRLITLRNLSWEPKHFTVKLDKTVGLDGAGTVELRQFHPTERIIGRFKPGAEVKVEVLAFRSCLLLATSKPSGELGVEGCDYQVVRDAPGKSVIIKLLGMPGTKAAVKLAPTGRKFAGASLNGASAADLLKGKTVEVAFAGAPLKGLWHRKLGELKETKIPADAEALYEASCFSADNNALEYRSVERSGPTKIPQVRAAREIFFAQKLLRERGCCDRFMFDGDAETFFGGPRARVIRGGALRLDFGKDVRLSGLDITGSYDDSGISNIIPARYLAGRDGKPGGLTGEYFQGSKFEGKPVVTRFDRQISFRWRGDPVRGVSGKDYCIRWTGRITPAKSGSYRFSTGGNRGARLWVDGKLVIKPPSGKDAAIAAGAIDLKAGKACEIKLEHVRRLGGTRVQLAWADNSPAAPQVSNDLARWRTVAFKKTPDGMTVDLSAAGPVRYFRMGGTFTTLREVAGRSPAGQAAKRDAWRGSNLFASYGSAAAVKAWQCSFELAEAARGAYLCIAVNGRHGPEMAYAALRVAGKPAGCPARAPSYMVNQWEYPVRPPVQNMTYYVPVTGDMIGKPIDAVVLGLDGVGDNVAPAVWLTAYPIPHESVELILETNSPPPKKTR
ncbi:MAG: hypothetical protein ISS69_07965 [Phycisphaerae bacterium]|nr:hypothetical protein [Phycisphaerae bacterium]